MTTQVNRARKILVVDDNQALATLMVTQLVDAGYEAIAVESANEAIVEVSTSAPDLAVLDIVMSGKSGLELAGLLRDQFRVPFVFLSALNDSNTVQQATAAGALAYLVKPQDLRQFVPLVTAALARADELSHLRATESQLATALQQSRAISMAIGLLMERNRLDRDSAYATLRDNARSRRRSMSQVAEELLNATEQLNSYGASVKAKPARDAKT
jgi:response regulator NasT